MKANTWTKKFASKNNIVDMNLSAVPKFTNTVSDLEIGIDNVLFVAMDYHDVSVSTPTNIIEQDGILKLLIPQG